MGKGIENPEVIDLVAENESRDEFILAIVQEQPWVGDADQLALLEEKLQNYLKFALDGPMARAYPESVGKGVRIRLYTEHPLDEHTEEYLGRARSAMKREGVTFEIKAI